MDLEMTGLDPVEDRILEVAAIVTDWDFNELATFEAVQRVDTERIEQRMVGLFWEENAAARDALIVQNKTGKECQAVETELLRFVNTWFARDERVVLAGNSIHQDRKFIDREWPRLGKRLHYRMLDVSAWKVVFEGKYGKKFAKPETHRALSDIRGSIEELKYYLSKCQVTKRK